MTKIRQHDEDLDETADPADSLTAEQYMLRYNETDAHELDRWQDEPGAHSKDDWHWTLNLAERKSRERRPDLYEGLAWPVLKYAREIYARTLEHTIRDGVDMTIRLEDVIVELLDRRTKRLDK